MCKIFIKNIAPRFAENKKKYADLSFIIYFKYVYVE